MAILKIKKAAVNDRVESMKKNIRKTRQLTLQIDSVLMREFKSRAVEQEMSMTEIIIRAMENYLK